MRHRCALRAAIVMIVLAAAVVAAVADDAKYPDWGGQWIRIGGGGGLDPTKPPGRGQQPPFTPQYQAIWETRLADSEAGGQKYNPQIHCLPSGMPRMMMAYDPMEVIVTPNTTYVQLAYDNEFRRIYTDGRDWPENAEPTFAGYSIGKWVGDNGDGRYDALEVETRDLRGPRVFDGLGMPMHEDNQTVIMERIYLDKDDADVLHNRITTIDHAFTQPWTVTRSYKRDRHEVWVENFCHVSNQYVIIGDDTFVLSGDGYLMPVKKGQKPPDLRYFNQAEQ
jgi:hypothetical protein